MRGSIVKRSENSYTIILNIGKDPTTGKRKQQWVTVKGNKRDAEKHLSELLHQLDTGTFVKPSKLTVGEYLESWLLDYCKPNLSPRTNELYSYITRKHILPALGGISLRELKPQCLQKLYADKRVSGLSNRTVQLIHITLHKAFKNAVKAGLLVRNMAEVVDVPKAQRREMRVMSETDLHILLEYAKDTSYYGFFYLSIFTGMRRSELLALRWCDIDLDLGQLSVTRSMQYLDNAEPEKRISFKEPKTSKSRRLISLSPSTVIMLRGHQAEQRQRREAIDSAISDSDLVFSHYDGKPLLPSSVTHAWIKLVRRCGLKGIRLHDTRHTHASLMLKAGVHPKIVQERLGHSSIQITLDTYSHVVPGLQQAAANRFDDILMPKPKESVTESMR